MSGGSLEVTESLTNDGIIRIAGDSQTNVKALTNNGLVTVDHHAALHVGSSLSNSATIDVSGTLIVETDMLAEITNQIANARNHDASSNPVPGAWAGQGITSSAAKADLRQMTGLGATYNEGKVTVKYTWNGDANLDGLVNADDYFQIDSGFISQAKGWYNGDFNYDGVINADDYFLIDSAFIGQGGPLSAGHSGVTAVPEPGTLGLLLAGAAALMARRRPHLQPC
jgi:hypothetical protein